MYLGKYLLGPNDTPENGIYMGDARILSEAIPDESISLIFTDPVYQNVDDYRWLAETAARILRPNSTCLIFCGIGYLPQTLVALSDGGLFYRWCIPHLTPGTSGYCDTGPSRWMAMVWCDNSGHTSPSPRLYDVVFTNGIQDWHVWRKNVGGIARWLNSFPGIVFDPFCGGGTVPVVCKILGRKYLAFEIDPKVTEQARERVRNTQPPLFVLAPEQIAMEFPT